METTYKMNNLRNSGHFLLLLGIILMTLILPVSAATVEENAEAIGNLQTALTVVWLVICGGIVFLMHAGFSLLRLALPE
jgi:Amt family ammonium transporter